MLISEFIICLQNYKEVITFPTISPSFEVCSFNFPVYSVHAISYEPSVFPNVVYTVPHIVFTVGFKEFSVGFGVFSLKPTVFSLWRVVKAPWHIVGTARQLKRQVLLLSDDFNGELSRPALAVPSFSFGFMLWWDLQTALFVDAFLGFVDLLEFSLGGFPAG